MSHASAFHRSAERIVFASRPAVLLLFALITAVMLFFAAQLRVDAGFKKQLPLDHEYIETFLDYEDAFGGANRLLVAVMARDGDMFDTEFFRVMERVTEDVKSIRIPQAPGDDDEIAVVNSGTLRSIFTPNVRFVEVVEDGFAGGNVIPARFAPNMPGFEATDEDFQTIRSNIVKAGIIGRLVARDFSGAMVLAELIPESATPTGKIDYQAVAAELEAIRQKYENDDIEIHIIGFAKIVGDIAEGARSVVAFFGIAMVLTLILLVVYSGSPKVAICTLIAAITAVIWQMGLLRLLGFGIDPMNILTPFLIFAIGVSHGVQMISSWINEHLFSGQEDSSKLAASPGQNSFDAAKRSFRRLLVPGSIALLSDCIGFVTILFINIRIIQELAITASIGVAVIIFTNLILLPTLLSYVRIGNYEKYRARRIHGASSKDGLWKFIANVARPVPAAIIVLVTVGLFVWGYDKGKGMQIGDSQAGVPELRQEARFNQDARAISASFALGIDVINVIAETDPQACTDNYQAMELIDRFAWHMQNIPGVQQVITLPSVAKIINAGWNEGNIRWRVIPRNKYNMRQNLQNIETDTGLLDSSCSAMPVQLFLTDHKADTITRVVDGVKKFREDNAAFNVNFRLESARLEEAAQAAGEELEPRSDASLRLATGSVGVMAATNEKVAEAQFPMLLWVYVAVILLCLMTYRSLTATICIVVPLALVSVLANALMAHLEIGLKVNTLPVAALGVGIGVDYAIYIYSRMQEFFERGDSLIEAYVDALKLSGAAVMFTAVTLAVGVGTWIFSDLQFQADMGILLAFMFLMNMVGAILILPAMLRWLMFPTQKVA